ncbi:MAG TPA: hypothetical protein VHY22_17135, partial [Chthoniobacteraceae bacterium]|nr:hypothetical protein [Chthoniobacteraceae bacterium]
GYGATFEEFKRVSDWVMVHGVNFVNQHLSFGTISGARKYDHPQTFSDHNAWWPSYRIVADHVARLSVLLSQGEQRNRVLVLHSTTTGWIECNPARQRLFGGPDPLEKLRESEAGLVQWLVDHQVDFDMGDELLMADLGKVEGAGLRIGQRSYSVIVVPQGMENWTGATRKLIEGFMGGGGIVIALRPPPTLVDGRPSPCEIRESWKSVSSLEALQTALDRIAPPLITTPGGEHLPALVGHQMRRYPNGDTLHLLVNSGTEAVRGEVRVRGASVTWLDTSTGEAKPAPCRRDGESVVLAMELAVAGHAAWLVSAIEIPAPASIEERFATIEVSDFQRIERTEPNVLGLDYCDLTVAGETCRGLYVTRANRRCWQAHGFDRDVWDRAVQFRHNYVDFEFDPESGFTVDFHFESAIERCDGLLLAVEHPELYQVTMNGHAVSFEDGARWLDETIRTAGVGHLLRTGVNTVTLNASPFHILCEIDRIYLVGDFSLEPAAAGFRIVKRAPLKLGDWTRQGLIQYPGSVRYTARFTLDRAAASFAVEVPQWAGSVIEVEIDGSPAGSVAFPPYQLRAGRALSAGSHEISICVIGTPVNLFGPHFWKVMEWPGPSAWDRDVPPQPAPGADYDIAPYGLLGPVRLMLNCADWSS